MDLLINKFKSMYKTSILFSIILIFIGVFLLTNPETTLAAISYFVGIVLIVWGLIPIIRFFSDKDSQNYLEIGFILGVFSFIFGIIIMIKPEIISSIIPLLMGIWMIINGGTKLYYALMLNKQTNSISAIIVSIIILICGMTLVCNPFGGAIVLTQIIGVSLIIYSILDLLECYNLNKTYKNIKKEYNNSNDKSEEVIDVEFKEKKKSKKKNKDKK